MLTGRVPSGCALVSARERDGRPTTRPATAVMEDSSVHFCSDGLALSPAAYSRLLTRLAEQSGVIADEFSRDGIVAVLEERMAEMLGTEMALFMPSGTLANNLALRLGAARPSGARAAGEPHLQRFRRLRTGAERAELGPPCS